MKLKKALFVLLAGILLAGCGAVQFKIISYPEGKSKTESQLDNLEYSNLSKVQGPCLWGVGYAIYHEMAKNRYQECMEKRGYKVEPE